jgi:hypothetical protein
VRRAQPWRSEQPLQHTPDHEPLRVCHEARKRGATCPLRAS